MKAITRGGLLGRFVIDEALPQIGDYMPKYPKIINLTPPKKKGDASRDQSKERTTRSEQKAVSKSTDRQKPGVELPAPSYKVIWLPIGSIKVDVANRRPIIPGVVKDLVAAIPKDGLRTPLTVRLLNGVAHLITGFQRLEALKILKWDEVPCVKIRGDRPAQRWQIVENLQRGELTKLQRANQTKALLELEGDFEETSGEKIEKKKPGRPEGGDAKAARTLSVRGKTVDAKRKNIAEDRKISGIDPDAQQALIDAGLDDNRKALREVADELTREGQIAKVRALAKGSRKIGDDDADQADDSADAEPPLVLLKRAWKKAKKFRSAWHNAAPEEQRRFIIEDLEFPLEEESEAEDDDDENYDDGDDEADE